MDEVQAALRQRFPLLTSVKLFHSSGEAESLASFMGVLLATMDGSRDSSFCFVFPRKAGVAPMSAVLYALGRFAVDFPMLADRYAKTNFTKDQRVRIVPEDKVFVFGGIWPEMEKWFRLKLLDDKRNTVFNWSVSEILRIEPTTHKIPKGREVDITRSREQAPFSTLDRLIGTRTFGNPSLTENYVLYLGARTEVDDFLANTSLGSLEGDIRSTLDHIVVPGIITDAGEIRHLDNYQAAGQPLIAVSSRIEQIAAACKLAAPRSKVVLVDGVKRISDLAKFDVIAESQNLIIVAEPDEEEKLQQLHVRGCKFWRFSIADLEMGEAGHGTGPFFGGIFRSALNEATLRTEVVACRNLHLEEVTSALEACQAALDESDGDETQILLGQIYSLLTHCAGLLCPPEVEERALLLGKAASLSRAAEDRVMWLSDGAATFLTTACAEVIRAIEDPELGQAKGNALEALLEDLRRQEIAPVALVARSAYNRQNVAGWLGRKNLRCPVLLPAKIAENGFFERLICTSWPGSGSFGRVVRKFAAPHIHLIAYPFESQWLHWFGRKQRNRQIVPDLTPLEKSNLLGVSGTSAWPAQPESAPLPLLPVLFTAPHQIDLEDRMTRKGLIPVVASGEETLPTTLVSFVGDAYAFLTDTVRVPVITDLTSGTAGGNFKVPRRRLTDINAGDVLVFRERGRRDVIQALADVELGTDSAVIRERAALWHKALRESGLNEASLMTELDAVKCPRTLQTVRSWLADDSMIGPQTKADLEAIAYAVGNEKLLEAVPSIWDAIRLIRSEHLSAGMRLSNILLAKLPEKLDELQEGRTRIEIDNRTSAWIVQVEAIADRAEFRPRSYVNALLWDTDDLF